MALKSGAQILVESLIAHDVELIFGIPGAKVDSVFDVLKDKGPRLILCRHEQNAAFMAAIYGRLTGKPGVVLVTSGPGVSNLATGLLTATTEGDPVVAIGANVPRNMHYNDSHQGTDNVALMTPVCKQAVEINASVNISEAVCNAFRVSKSPRRGATFISVPQDVLLETANTPIVPPIEDTQYGAAPISIISTLAHLIQSAKLPVLLFGMDASIPSNVTAIRALLRQYAIACVGTYQAAGVISEDLLHCFVGRVGLFKNQPGDILLDKADLVITIGYSTVEYDPEIWNQNKNKTLVHLDAIPAKIHASYQPHYELIGGISHSIHNLQLQLPKSNALAQQEIIESLQKKLHASMSYDHSDNAALVHPLFFIKTLKECITNDSLVISDVGSHYMWLSRYLFSYQPHHLLFSNGQQTLGVAQPWAIASSLLYPDKQVISISGDGGFLFSAQELETAVREGVSYVHCVWTDGSYDMVKQQQLLKYKRESHVEFGTVDMVKFAQSFGASGFNVTHPAMLKEVLQQALKTKGPSIVNIPIDYSDNSQLFKTVHTRYLGH